MKKIIVDEQVDKNTVAHSAIFNYIKKKHNKISYLGTKGTSWNDYEDTEILSVSDIEVPYLGVVNFKYGKFYIDNKGNKAFIVIESKLLHTFF